MIQQYPEFKAMYEEVYTICRNVERVMGMFSKELQELDRNTVQYMIDEMQETIDQQKNELEKRENELEERESELEKALKRIKELENFQRN